MEAGKSEGSKADGDDGCDTEFSLATAQSRRPSGAFSSGGTDGGPFRRLDHKVIM